MATPEIEGMGQVDRGVEAELRAIQAAEVAVDLGTLRTRLRSDIFHVIITLIPVPLTLSLVLRFGLSLDDPKVWLFAIIFLIPIRAARRALQTHRDFRTALRRQESMEEAESPESKALHEAHALEDVGRRLTDDR